MKKPLFVDGMAKTATLRIRGARGRSEGDDAVVELMEIQTINLMPLGDMLREMGYRPYSVDAILELALKESVIEALRDRLV